MNGAATHQWTIVYYASHRSYVEDKLSKKTRFAPTPYLETPKDIATKSGETQVRDRALQSWKLSRNYQRKTYVKVKGKGGPYSRRSEGGVLISLS